MNNKHNMGNRYTNEKTQEILAIKSKEQSEYINKISDALNDHRYNVEKIPFNSDYIDEILKVGKKVFVFRITTSNHQVGVSIKSKWWKIRSDKAGITTTYRKKKNPVLYVENVFNKIVLPTLDFEPEVYFIYPVKKPENLAANVRNHFIGDAKSTYNFILESIK